MFFAQLQRKALENSKEMGNNYSYINLVILQKI